MRKSNIRAVFFQNDILHYRYAFYNRLAKQRETEITVCHSDKKEVKGEGIFFRTKRLRAFRFIFFNMQLGMWSILKENDVAVLPLDPTQSSFYLPFFFPRKKFIYFGIGLGRNKLLNWLRALAINKYPVLTYSPKGAAELINFSRGKHARIVPFHNTVDVKVEQSPASANRDRFIFVGSLDYRKRVDKIIAAFHTFVALREDVALLIVGDGPERGNLESLTRSLGLSEKVSFVGREADRQALARHYSKAIGSIHFGQAGLSVIQSLGHGVPCIINPMAISGGEKDAAINGFNSLSFDGTEAGLVGALLNICNETEMREQLAKNARTTYERIFSIDQMVSAFDLELQRSKK